MNPPFDDSMIRELLQRQKRADERHVPAFDEVLGRPVRTPLRRPARRLQLAVACCAVAALLFVYFHLGSVEDNPNLRSRPDVAENHAPSQPIPLRPDERIVTVDFNHLRRAVEEHFIATQTSGDFGTPVWSSRTESLLALNLDLSLTQE